MKKKEFKSKWLVTDQRFVAFLDIMGFKDAVSRNTHQYIYKKLCSLAGSVDSYRSDQVYTTIFSDSIVLFSKDKTKKSFDEFIWAVSVIVNHSFLVDFGIKGAIAFGTMTVDPEKQVFFGQPLIDAHLLGEELAYFGVIFHHTADKKINSWNIDFMIRFAEKQIHCWDSKVLLMELPTKLKSGVGDHINLMWPAFYNYISEDPTEVRDEPLELMNDFKALMSGKVRIYLDNTIEFIKKHNHILEEVKQQSISSDESQSHR